MKNVKRLGLVLVFSVLLASGCNGKEKTEEKETVQDKVVDVVDVEETKPAESNPEGTAKDQADGISTLVTDDKSISITVLRPEGFEDTEYSSEYQVAFQRLGEDGESSTQLNLRLMMESEEEAMTTAQQEVAYLLSANSDDTGMASDVQDYATGERQWTFFTYSQEGMEGIRAWTSLANGCVLSCAAENFGSGLEPLSMESILQTLDASIQE